MSIGREVGGNLARYHYMHYKSNLTSNAIKDGPESLVVMNSSEEEGRRHVPPNRLLTFNKLCGIIS
jgi:hypothetical protein